MSEPSFINPHDVPVTLHTAKATIIVQPYIDKGKPGQPADAIYVVTGEIYRPSSFGRGAALKLLTEDVDRTFRTVGGPLIAPPNPLRSGFAPKKADEAAVDAAILDRRKGEPIPRIEGLAGVDEGSGTTKLITSDPYDRTSQDYDSGNRAENDENEPLAPNPPDCELPVDTGADGDSDADSSDSDEPDTEATATKVTTPPDTIPKTVGRRRQR